MIETKEELRDLLQKAIENHTSKEKEAKVPKHCYSGYINGKLFRSAKGRTVWNRKSDVIRAIKEWSQIGWYVNEYHFAELCELYPECFYESGWGKCTKDEYKDQIYSKLDSATEEWWKTHLEVKEVLVLE